MHDHVNPPPHQELPAATANHALGNLIRILSTLEPLGAPLPGIPARKLLEWLLDRFQLQESACSAKMLGDSLSFANRLGLIAVERKVRTKSKLIHYTGISLAQLDAAFTEWSRSTIPCPLSTTAPRGERISVPMDRQQVAGGAAGTSAPPTGICIGAHAPGDPLHDWQSPGHDSDRTDEHWTEGIDF